MFKPAFCQRRPNPAGQGTKAPSIAFSWCSSLPVASPQTLQTLQMPFWQPQLCRPGQQGPINSFSWRSSLPFASPQNPPNAPNAFLGLRTGGQGTKTPSLAFSWRSSLPFASPETLQTLQMPFWQPSNPPNPPNAFLAAPTPQAKAPRPHQ